MGGLGACPGPRARWESGHPGHFDFEPIVSPSSLHTSVFQIFLAIVLFFPNSTPGKSSAI